MSLQEMAVSYRHSAGLIRTRMKELEADCEASKNQEEREQLALRVSLLRPLWRETRDLAVLMERYYERGYRRNERYTV